MLYYLFDLLERNIPTPGAGLFQFLSFRAAVAALISLLLSTLLGNESSTFLKSSANWREYSRFGISWANEKSRHANHGRDYHHSNCDYPSVAHGQAREYLHPTLVVYYPLDGSYRLYRWSHQDLQKGQRRIKRDFYK